MATMNYPSSSATSPSVLSAPPPYPKIICVLGCETLLGAQILTDLLHSPQVDKVYAIAFSDFPLLSTLPSALLRKVRVIMTAPDHLDRSLARVAECDIAFCLMPEALDRFAHAVFHLGTLHLSCTQHQSQEGSDNNNNNNNNAEQFEYVRSLRREAGVLAPGISVFHVARTLKSNDVATTMTNTTQRDVNQIKDVAAAMEIDAFYKAALRPPPQDRSKKAPWEVFDTAGVYTILEKADYQNSWNNPV